ncbi:hypothetical protein Tco_0464629 [Tanacetum coccineum]
MGELTFLLGLQVQHKEDGIFISQDKYVAEILKKFDFATVKTASTLMEPNNALVKDEEAENVDVHLYRSMIGSLMYLTASRPDIIYLKGQPKLGLWYPRDSPFDLEAFSDSDYAVANSTTKAEYVVAAHCCGQVLWIYNQMLDYGFNFMNTMIYTDNESTICIVKNLVFHSKTKHIEIRHHFIRGSYEKKLIQVIKIHTDYNVTDLLTKAFDVSRQIKRGQDTKIPQSSGPPEKVGDLRLSLGVGRGSKSWKGKKKSRTPGLKRLRKVGESRRVESSEDKDSLGAQEDASKQGRIFEDIDKDAEDDLMVMRWIVDYGSSWGEEETRNRVQKVDEREVSTGVEDSDAPTILVTTAGEGFTATKIDEITTTSAPTTASRGVVVQEPSEFRTTTSSPQASQPSKTKDKGKAIMIEPEVPLKKKDQVALDEKLEKKFDEA